MAIPIGKLRDQVDILRASIKRDSAGGESRTYSVISSPFVWLKALRGREFFAARQVVSEVTHKIVGHYDELKDITPENRIREIATGREFDVQIVLPIDRDSVEIFAVHRSNA